jgi:putative hydrolase of the HAD superfamily
MISDIDAIAFDIDGTLYRNFSFNRMLGPFLARHTRLLITLGSVRNEIRALQKANPDMASDDFFHWQAELLAGRLGISADEAEAKVENLIYSGWKPLFARVKPYSGARETISAFRDAGYKIGLLSDFLPSQKGDVWGIAPLCEVVLGAEETGALKPSPIPFRALASKLGVDVSRILYVGNSLTSDIRGARAVGMKTALIAHPLSILFGRAAREADISFSSYRQLKRIVLE